MCARTVFSIQPVPVSGDPCLVCPGLSPRRVFFRTTRAVSGLSGPVRKGGNSHKFAACQQPIPNKISARPPCQSTSISRNSTAPFAASSNHRPMQSTLLYTHRLIAHLLSWNVAPAVEERGCHDFPPLPLLHHAHTQTHTSFVILGLGSAGFRFPASLKE
ncbi:hypothetical protein LZ32DRAFT_598566 [Colletotrichum eremochloae]|nr:hypothetical protein LZ32DRAFT_598566 [Colletotrichum eremochloae]